MSGSSKEKTSPRQPAPPGAQLPDAIVPVLVQATHWMLEHSGEDGRLMLEPDAFRFQNWYDLAALALLYTRKVEGNPFCGDERVGALIDRAGRALIAEYNDPEQVDMAGWWYGNRPHEWVVESWLLSYELLQQAGAGALTAGWEEPLCKSGATFDRYCRQVEHLRRMTSPNLKISTNHFAYFAADLLRIGQVFGIEAYVNRGLSVARRIAAHQHPDGYWAESHGPTTSYNMVTVGALGLCDCYSGEAIFEQVLRRALDFHLRFTYPDGVCLETIDQRVRYPACSVMGLYAFSRWPEGRGWAELRFAHELSTLRTPAGRGAFGRLAGIYVHYRPGPAATPVCSRPAWHARLTDLPGGLAKRDSWLVALSGIPSRPRNHHYTLDRQNLLSVWHRDCGLIIGGGNNRDAPASATFYSHIMSDPGAVVRGITHEDCYIPVGAELDLGPAGGSLDLEYMGFDARLTVEIVDDCTCRISAFAGTLPVNEPILFNPNILVDATRPVRTAGGQLVQTGQEHWELDAEQVGGWFGQGDWRIELAGDCPGGWRLCYPLIPYRQNPATKPEQRLAVLTVPVTNRTVELVVRTGGLGGQS